MIETNIIMFIIMLVLTYAFDHKIIPQIGIVALATYSIYTAVVGVVVIESAVIPVFLFVINMVYSVYMIMTEDNAQGIDTITGTVKTRN